MMFREQIRWKYLGSVFNSAGVSVDMIISVDIYSTRRVV